jgi:IclR family acetate operon transcriptional repressor
MSNTPDHADLSEVIDPSLREIRDEFREGTILAVPSGDSMVYLEFFPSDHILAVREAIGAIRPMHCSAVGKAYLSALEPGVLQEVVGRLSYDAGTHRAAKNAVDLVERIVAARDVGYAVDRDETSVGVSCVASPLWVGRSLIGAVGVTGPSSRLPDEVAARIGQRLRTAVDELRRPIDEVRPA